MLKHQPITAKRSAKTYFTGDAYMHHLAKSPFGTKPLPGPTSTYDHLNIHDLGKI